MEAFYYETISLNFFYTQYDKKYGANEIVQHTNSDIYWLRDFIFGAGFLNTVQYIYSYSLYWILTLHGKRY